MSDIFNSSSNKIKISKILSLDPSTKTIEENFPKSFNPPPEALLRSRETYTYATELGLTIRTPRAIPELVIRATKEYLPVDLIENKWVNDKVSLPVGVTEFIPKYTQTQHFSSYDQGLYKQYLYTTINSDNSKDDDLFIAYDKICRTVVYGSGSKAGQLQRFKAMQQVRYGLDGMYPSKPFYNIKGYKTFEDVAKVLEETMPVCGPKEGQLPLNDRISGYLRPDEIDTAPFHGDYLPEINMKAASGIPYVGKTKQQTVTEAITLADEFMSAISDVLKNQKKLKDAIEKYWFLGCYIMIAKSERYDVEKWETNTRNVMGLPFATHLIGNLILSPVMSNSNINATNYDTPSLQKFNPYHGGLQAILDKSLEPGSHMFIYADNIYVSWERPDGAHDWSSVDVVKAEANAVPANAAAIAYYVLTRGWVNRAGNPRFNATWAALATQVLPILFVDSTALVNNLQLKMPGQGSGNSWTYVINQYLTSIYYMEWKTNGKPKPGSSEFDHLTKVVGFNVKIERVIENLEQVLEDCRLSTPHTGVMQTKEPAMPYSLLSPPLFNLLPQVELDLLGWGCVYSNRLDMFIPSLDTARLLKSAAYPKKIENRDYANKQYAFRAYEIIRYEALLYVGGCYQGRLAQALYNMASARRGSLSEDMSLKIEPYLANWKDISEFGTDTNWGEEINMALPFGEAQLIELNQGFPAPINDSPRVFSHDRLIEATSHKAIMAITNFKAPVMLTSWAQDKFEDALKKYNDVKMKANLTIEDLRKVTRSWADEADTVNLADFEESISKAKLKGLRELELIREHLQTPTCPEDLQMKTMKYAKDYVNYADYVKKFGVPLAAPGDTQPGYHPPTGTLSQATKYGIMPRHLPAVESLNRNQRKMRNRRAKLKGQ